jgi:hypothetical protein
MTSAQTGFSNYWYSPCGCGCASCKSCPNGVSQCWTFTTTGNSIPAYDGTFCLVQSKSNPCVFIDGCTNHWTLTLNGGATTLASDNGAVYTLTENLNCTGLNAFGLAKSPSGSTWQQSLTINPTNCNAYPCYPNCAPPPCSALCPNGISQCWLLTIGGAPLAVFNGTFCLGQQSGSTCFFADKCSGLYSMTISGGTVTVQTVDGTVKWSLSGNTTFQCNGSNTFYLTTSPSGTTWPATVTITSTNCATSPCYPNCPPLPTCQNCFNTGKTIAPCWTFTISGVTGGASGCAGFNTTFYLLQTGPCTFSSCAAQMVVGGTCQITIGNAIYTAPGLSFNCTGCNTFTLHSVNSGATGVSSCSGWPATINVCPSSNCPTSQSCFCGCSDSLPLEYEVSLSGISNSTCFTIGGVDCTWANGTFALVYNGIGTVPGEWGFVAPSTKGSAIYNFIEMSITCSIDINTLLVTRVWYMVLGSQFLNAGAGYLCYRYSETVDQNTPCGGAKTLGIYDCGLNCRINNQLVLICPGAPGSVTINPV